MDYEEYRVISQGDGGFDSVVRYDWMAAKDAAEVHEAATGNKCLIEKIVNDEKEGEIKMNNRGFIKNGLA